MLLRLNLWDGRFEAMPLAWRDVSWDLRKVPYKTSVLKQKYQDYLKFMKFALHKRAEFHRLGFGREF